MNYNGTMKYTEEGIDVDAVGIGTRDEWIGTPHWRGLQESLTLNVPDVGRLADDVGDLDLHESVDLVGVELRTHVVGVSEEVTISIHEVLELLGDDASEGGTDGCTIDGTLREATSEEVDVGNLGVE